jgi:hypothetical protein
LDFADKTRSVCVAALNLFAAAFAAAAFAASTFLAASISASVGLGVTAIAGVVAVARAAINKSA